MMPCDVWKLFCGFLYFFEGEDLKVYLSWSLKRGEHRDDTSIVDGDQEGAKY